MPPLKLVKPEQHGTYWLGKHGFGPAIFTVKSPKTGHVGEFIAMPRTGEFILGVDDFVYFPTAVAALQAIEKALGS